MYGTCVQGFAVVCGWYVAAVWVWCGCGDGSMKCIAFFFITLFDMYWMNVHGFAVVCGCGLGVVWVWYYFTILSYRFPVPAPLP